MIASKELVTDNTRQFLRSYYSDSHAVNVMLTGLDLLEEDLVEMCETYPNDFELGMRLRLYIIGEINEMIEV